MTLIAAPKVQTAIDAQWADVMGQLTGFLHAKDVHASRVVVLVPYAQLMQQAKTAWASYCQSRGEAGAAASFFVPRFETTMNWASGANWVTNSRGVALAPGDIHMDAAIDALTAANLLERAGLAAQQHVLAGRLVEAAWSLAGVAAAQPPGARLAWGARLALEMGGGMEAPALALELAVARIALAWAASSSYPSDVLFNADLDLLVVLDGFQSEPLAEALKTHFGERALAIQLQTPDLPGLLCLHAAQDMEDEAHRAAACVLQHLNEGRSPVALIAQDRVLTRRVRAMLAGKGLALRDETGWKLSTTRAAATLMGLLRALPWDASTDAVLDWLKNAPAFEAGLVTRAEIYLRKTGVRFWRNVPVAQPDAQQDMAPVAAQVATVVGKFQRLRLLADWLHDTRLALQAAGQWQPLADDLAGKAVLATLFLEEGNYTALPTNPRMSLQDFTAWVNQTLEAASFAPTHAPQAQVVILPLSQLLGRPMPAVVLPGCDEVRLAVSPEPPGMWTPSQRHVLGLLSRSQLASAARAAWHYALCMPHIDVLWRQSEAGERLMPSGFVQEVLLTQAPPLAADPRTQRLLAPMPVPHPLPTGNALPLSRLSASAYEDLRRCPYRFFALRLLKLQEADELESELGKREFGNWLHLLLKGFHEQLKATPAQEIRAREAMINIAADKATQALGLSAEEFLPFTAIWPRVRAGYLDWLATHEASGAHYLDGEVWKDMPLGSIALVGKIDRIDQLSDGSRVVMDYKTEARATTQARINDAGEDTQLAFYAALLHDDTLAAAYVNLGEKEATKTYAQAEIVDLRDDLIGGILSDMGRIADGAPLPALGEGKACEYCAARGLCRKDFWT